MCPSKFQNALQALKRDPIMAFLAHKFAHEITLSDRYESDHAKALALLVVEQQVSFKAALTIKQRFLKIIDRLSYSEILALDNDLIQSAGLSKRKVDYIKNIYQHFLDEPKNYEVMDYDQIHNALIQIKGVGRWTIEMFLIFVLGAQDIFSKGDLALINSIKRNYNLDPLTDLHLNQLIEQWRPYNTVASLLLWRSVEQKIYYTPEAQD